MENGWGDLVMRLQAFFVAHTEIQMPTLHEICRETLNPHIGTVTPNSNLQIVFNRVFFTTFIYLPGCIGEPLGDVSL